MVVAEQYKFVHVPKTGGSFVFCSLRDLGIQYSGKAWQHDEIPEYDSAYSYFACIRDPVHWMCSLYYWRKRFNWNWKDRDLENRCRAESLVGFFEKLSSSENKDIVLDYYRYFLGNLPSDKVTYLRTGFLNEDLCTFLEAQGLAFDKQMLLQMPPVNKKPDYNKLAVSSDLLDRFKSNNLGYYTEYDMYLETL